MSSSSCSILLKQAYEEDKNRIKLLPQEAPNLYCENKKSNFELFGPYQKNQRNFIDFLKRSKETFLPVERFTLWAILHTELRPDKVSIRSQVRLFEYQQKTLTFREFKTEETPFTNALSNLLERYHSKWSVSKLTEYLQKNYNFPLLVDDELEAFLEKNKDLLWSKKDLRDLLFKDNQIIKAGESLPVFKGKSIGVDKKNTLSDSREILSEKSSYFCDFDPAFYKDQPHKVIPVPEKAETPLVLGLIQGDQNFTITIDQNFEIKEKETLFVEPYFKLPIGSPTRAPSFCSFNFEKGHALFISYKERDPGQLLTDVMAQMNKKFNSKKEVTQILSSFRQMVLHHPTRIILEADADRLSQKKDNELDSLFKGAYPVYQSKALGQIDTILMGMPNAQNGFIKDKRSQYNISCQDI